MSSIKNYCIYLFFGIISFAFAAASGNPVFATAEGQRHQSVWVGGYGGLRLGVVGHAGCVVKANDDFLV